MGTTPPGRRTRTAVPEEWSSVHPKLGKQISGFSDGIGTSALFQQPYGVAVDSAGTLFVADFGGNRIRMVTQGGVVTTLAGNRFSGNSDGMGTSALFFRPAGIAVDTSGAVYVADSQNNRIRRIILPNVLQSPPLVPQSLPPPLLPSPPPSLPTRPPTPQIPAATPSIPPASPAGSSPSVTIVIVVLVMAVVVLFSAMYHRAQKKAASERRRHQLHGNWEGLQLLPLPKAPLPAPARSEALLTESKVGGGAVAVADPDAWGTWRRVKDVPSNAFYYYQEGTENVTTWEQPEGGWAV